MRSGKGRPSVIFEKRLFWPQIIWIAALVLGVAIGCALSSQELVTATVIAVFLGLNETSRWAYRTNLLICSAAAVIGMVAGVFTWLQMVFIFVLFSVVSGYLFYFRDSARRMLPYMEEFSADIAEGKSLEETTTLAVDIISAMSGGEAVFIAVSDQDGGLYLPDYHDEGRIDLKRNGGAVWKVFATGRSYMTGGVEPSKDLPLDREARSLVSVPLLSRGVKIGVLQLESDQPNAFTVHDLTRLELLGFIVSQALFNFVFEAGGGEGGESGGYKLRPRNADARGEEKKPVSKTKPEDNDSQTKLDLELPAE